MLMDTIDQSGYLKENLCIKRAFTRARAVKKMLAISQQSFWRMLAAHLDEADQCP